MPAGKNMGGPRGAQFTQGPWFLELERANTSRGFCRIIGSKAKPNRGNLAHVMGLYVDPKNTESNANARLIAAAPELYRELSNAVVLLRAAGVEETTNGTIRAAEAALAKARGEQ